MQLAIQQYLLDPEPRPKPLRSVNLSDRDYQMMEFLLDMKFAGIEDLFERFFKTTKSSSEAKNDLWTKKRIFQLEKSKFIKSVKSFSESKRYIVASFKAYYALASRFPEKTLTKPSAGIDLRTFDHDKLLLKIRGELERSQKISSWISDRKLRTFPDLCGGLNGVYVPDAIYETASGEKIAFELEIAAKGKERYREKIRRYVYFLRSSNLAATFSKVHFVCAKDLVKKHIEAETKLYPQFFRVESLSNYFPTQKQTI